MLAGPGGLCPPATLKQVAATEKALGFPLHETHRELLLRVANGGFGPGYGLLGVGTAPRGETSCLATWRRLNGGDTSIFPAETAPLWDFGCACWVLVHATSPAGTIRYTTSYGVYELQEGICEIMTAWLEGREVYEMLFDKKRAPMKWGINPFTKERLRIVGEGPALGRLILSYDL